MKLATLKTHSRDGQLVVVSRDLKTAALVPHIASTLQQAIENWDACLPKLEECYQKLNSQTLSNSLNFQG